MENIIAVDVVDGSSYRAYRAAWKSAYSVISSEIRQFKGATADAHRYLECINSRSQRKTIIKHITQDMNARDYMRMLANDMMDELDMVKAGRPL